MVPLVGWFSYVFPLNNGETSHPYSSRVLSQHRRGPKAAVLLQDARKFRQRRDFRCQAAIGTLQKLREAHGIPRALPCPAMKFRKFRSKNGTWMKFHEIGWANTGNLPANKDRSSNGYFNLYLTSDRRYINEHHLDMSEIVWATWILVTWRIIPGVVTGTIL